MPEKPARNLPEDRFIEAFTQAQSALRGFCAASLGNSEDAKEVFQKASLVLWKKADIWDPETSFLRWAFSVVRFEILAHVRDRARDRLIFDEDIVQAMASTSERLAESQSERIDALERCVANLKPEHWETLAAYYVHGHRLREIAEQQNRGLSAVKVMLMRLRESLAKCIQGQLADPG